MISLSILQNTIRAKAVLLHSTMSPLERAKAAFVQKQGLDPQNKTKRCDSGGNDSIAVIFFLQALLIYEWESCLSQKSCVGGSKFPRGSPVLAQHCRHFASCS